MVEVTTGRKYAVRMRAMPRTAWFRARARPSAMASPSGTDTIV